MNFDFVFPSKILTETMKVSRQFQAEEKYLISPKPITFSINSRVKMAANTKLRISKVLASFGFSCRWTSSKICKQGNRFGMK